MNGGRKKWELEKRELVTDRPSFARSNYPIPTTDEKVRAYRDEVVGGLNSGKINLVDVRSPDEFTGKVIAPPGMSETAQRGGHIPAHGISPGPKPPTKTEHSKARPICEISTPMPASNSPNRPSLIAASASAPATPGSS